MGWNVGWNVGTECGMWIVDTCAGIIMVHMGWNMVHMGWNMVHMGWNVGQPQVLECRNGEK